jgi:hypothetical protein
MNKNVGLSSQSQIPSLWSLFSYLSIGEGLIASAALINLPSEKGLVIGLSPARLVVLASIVILIIFFGFLAYRKPWNFIISRIDGKYAAPTLLLCVTGTGLSLTIIALLNDLYLGTHTYAFLAYAERLAPLFIYMAVIFFQIVILILMANWSTLRSLVISEKPFLISWIAVFGGMILLVVLLSITRLGLTPDPIGWGSPTVPLLEWQIWMGIILCAASRFFAASRLFTRLSTWQQMKPALAGLIITLSIWAIAVLVWASQPIPPGFFATPPRAPNYEVYPFSDAAFYDFHAQSLLIGLGYRGESIPPRPLYIVFLAVSHLIAGQDYSRVIFIQTLLLAFFPVTIFWIAKKLSSITVGFIAALLVIMREWTSIISTPFTSDISNSKLMFADLPAAFVISLVVLITILWFENPRRLVYSLLAGGILGISLLIRTQIIILLPVMLVFLWIILLRQRALFKSFILPSLLFLFGFSLAVTPWLTRNYRIAGQLVFDHPESQTRVVAQRFNPETELTNFDRQPGESTGNYNQRLSAAIRDQVIKNPGYAIQFIMAHWLNSEIANLQIFPVRFSILSVSELFKPEHAFWEEWQGNATPRQTAVMITNLAILAAGAVFVVRKKSWAGIFPLVVNLAYHFSNAAARNSGWRYLLPVDWIFILYFACGIYALINLGVKKQVLVEQEVEIESKSGRRVPLYSLAAIATGIFCIGFTPLAAENAFPRLYPPATVMNVRSELVQAASELPSRDREGLMTALDDPHVVVMHGRMLYPRFYAAKEGEEKTGKTGYAPLPYARYVFLVAGEPEGTVIFPQTNSELPFRNASDVTVVGCMDGLAVKARTILLPGSMPQIYLADPAFPWTCDPQP